MKRKATLIIGAMILAGVLSACGGHESAPASSNESSTTITEEIPNASETMTAEEIKDAAKATDMDVIYRAVRSARAFNDEIEKKITKQDSLADLSAYCEKAMDAIGDSKDAIDAVEDEAATEYKDAADGYVSNVYMIAKYIQDFVDAQDTESLTKAQESIQAMPYAEEQVSAARKTYLEQAGLTAEEIDAQIALG